MRLRSLDSIRGIAAVTVLLNHCYLTFPEAVRSNIRLLDLKAWKMPWAWLRYTPLHAAVAGNAAVMVFFVLSGFVLTIPFIDGSQPNYCRYLIKRFFRIWPPFAVAIVIAATLFVCFGSTPVADVSRWFTDESWTHPIDLRDIGAHLMMTGMKRDMMLDNPMWSLVHELRISMIFPVLVLIVRAGAWRAIMGAFLLYVVCAMALRDVSEQTAVGTLLASGQFIVFFVVGIALVMHLALWRAKMAALSPRLRVLLWLALPEAFMFPATAPDIARLVWGAGAVGAIMLSLSSINAERALLWRPLQWLGRVSYSLYLTHIIILLTLVHLLDGRVPLPLIVAAVMALSFLCAGLMFRYIEQPSMRAGRYFTEMGRLPKPGTT